MAQDSGKMSAVAAALAGVELVGFRAERPGDVAPAGKAGHGKAGQGKLGLGKLGLGKFGSVKLGGVKPGLARR